MGKIESDLTRAEVLLALYHNALPDDMKSLSTMTVEKAEKLLIRNSHEDGYFYMSWLPNKGHIIFIDLMFNDKTSNFDPAKYNEKHGEGAAEKAIKAFKARRANANIPMSKLEELKEKQGNGNEEKNVIAIAANKAAIWWAQFLPGVRDDVTFKDLYPYTDNVNEWEIKITLALEQAKKNPVTEEQYKKFIDGVSKRIIDLIIRPNVVLICFMGSKYGLPDFISLVIDEIGIDPIYKNIFPTKAEMIICKDGRVLINQKEISEVCKNIPKFKLAQLQEKQKLGSEVSKQQKLEDAQSVTFKSTGIKLPISVVKPVMEKLQTMFDDRNTLDANKRMNYDVAFYDLFSKCRDLNTNIQYSAPLLQKYGLCNKYQAIPTDVQQIVKAGALVRFATFEYLLDNPIAKQMAI